LPGTKCKAKLYRSMKMNHSTINITKVPIEEALSTCSLQMPLELSRAYWTLHGLSKNSLTRERLSISEWMNVEHCGLFSHFFDVGAVGQWNVLLRFTVTTGQLDPTITQMPLKKLQALSLQMSNIGDLVIYASKGSSELA
ncbi:hypothetical protein ACJX0J_011705, partial [Zea mays]